MYLRCYWKWMSHHEIRIQLRSQQCPSLHIETAAKRHPGDAIVAGQATCIVDVRIVVSDNGIDVGKDAAAAVAESFGLSNGKDLDGRPNPSVHFVAATCELVGDGIRRR